MKKIVVLNSGGFDSTTLLADLASLNEYEIHSLHFSYGQPNYPYDLICARNNAKALGAIHHEVDLPRFSWSNSDFYSNDSNQYDTQYLEMRNVIFISYALSLAESINAESIYMAILAKGHYKDTSPEFITKMKDLCETLGIKFETPYSEYTKYQLFPFAKLFGVGKNLSFISCDTPVNGKPCGKCADCIDINRYKEYLDAKLPVQRFIEVGYTVDDKEFQDLFRKNLIGEMRVLLNNDCQLNCKHCYHNNNPLIGEILSDEELINAIVEARNIGIKNFHFAGKEPLYDDRIFRIIEGVKRKVDDVDFTVVTNGINLYKYADDIVKSGISKVFLSAEDMFNRDNNIRNNAQNAPVRRGILALDSRVPVEIFYDLTPDNIKNTVKNIRFWNEVYNVKSFHVRTIRLVGEAEKLPLLSVEQICKLHSELKNCEVKANIEFNLGVAPYTYDVLGSEDEITKEIKEDMNLLVSLGTTYVTENYRLFAEYYCNRYCNQITLTADGFVLGCAMECSVREYDKISAGNIRENTLESIIKKGKEITLEYNGAQVIKDDIFFEKCLSTPIDNS